MCASAGAAQEISLEGREVILADLDEIASPDTLSTSVTNAGEPGDPLRGYQVRAMIVTGVPLAFARLATDADPNLVMPIRLGAGGNQPTSAALVAVKQFVTVKLEEAKAAKDVGWLGGGWWRWLR